MGHIFISYSHKDSEYAHRLADTLQAEGFDVWIDARLDYGSQWPNELQKQLDACEAFILIMTPRSFASDWVQNELQRAKRKLKPVIPLLLEGDEPWLSVESTQYYDVRGERLPDSKFYSDLGEVAARHKGQAVQLPADQVKKSFKPNSFAGSTKRKRGVILAITGAAAILLAAAILFVGTNRSQNSTFPPGDSGTATSPAFSSNETLDPSVSSTVSGVMPGEISDASDFIDSKGVPMRLVSAGEFEMGSNSSAYSEERPAHLVYLDDYYIDKHEVTNALYKACVDADVCKTPNDTSRYGDSSYTNHPVVYVDWDMAQTYCGWREARLPTEAEWEKAARGMDRRTYPWGEDIDSTYANYNHNIGDTTAVGSYENGKSPYGVYDMSGNVWEWVADWYVETYYQDLPSSTISNPLGPDTGQYKVLRGGSWTDEKDFVRTFTRGWNDIDAFEFKGFGFRCAMDATP